MNVQVNKTNPVYYLSNAKQFNDKGINFNSIDNINITDNKQDTDVKMQDTPTMFGITKQKTSNLGADLYFNKDTDKVFKASEIFKEIEGTSMSYFEAEEKLKKAGYTIINDIPSVEERRKERLLQSIGAKSEVQLSEKDFVSNVINNIKDKNTKNDSIKSTNNEENFKYLFVGDVVKYIENKIRSTVGLEQVEEPFTRAAAKSFIGGIAQGGITLIDYLTPDNLVSTGFTKSLNEAYNYIEEWKETDNFIGKFGGEILGFFTGGGAVASSLKYLSKGSKLINTINNSKYSRIIAESIGGTIATGTRPDKQPISFSINIAAPVMFSTIGNLISKGAEYYKFGYTTHEIAKKINETIATTSDNVLKIIKKYNLHQTSIEEANNVINKVYKTIETKLQSLAKGKTIDIKNSLDAKKAKTLTEVATKDAFDNVNNDLGIALNTALDGTFEIISKNSNLHLDNGRIFFFDKIKGTQIEVNENTINLLKNKLSQNDLDVLNIIQIQNKLLNTNKLPMVELIDIYENVLKSNNLPEEFIKNNPGAFAALGKIRENIAKNLGNEFSDLMREKQILSLFIKQFQQYGYKLPYQDLSGSITLATGYTTGNPLLMIAGAIILGLKNKSFVEFLISSDKYFNILSKPLGITAASLIKKEENKKYKRIDLDNK